MSEPQTTPMILPFLGNGRPGMVDIYANQLRMAATMSDLTLIFGVTEDHGGNIYNADKASIRLAPATFKVLYLNLKMAIESYEASFGEIKISPKVDDEVRKNGEMLKAGLADLMRPDSPAAL